MTALDEDRLIEDWHDLAKKVESRVPVDLAAAKCVLGEALRVFAPTLKFPTDDAEIIPSIVGARKSEKMWNQRLMKVLIDAARAKDMEKLPEALMLLDQFAEKCPWTHFVKVAKDQCANYAAPASP